LDALAPGTVDRLFPQWIEKNAMHKRTGERMRIFTDCTPKIESASNWLRALSEEEISERTLQARTSRALCAEDREMLVCPVRATKLSGTQPSLRS
jgi:hypothetical protein